MAAKPERAPIGPVGRFVGCPLNGDAHPERVAYEVKRTWDKNGKERFSAVCPICFSRLFLNGWAPERSMRTLVAVEAEGFYLIGLTEARRNDLLKELGLRQVHQPAPLPPQHGWPSQQPPPQWPTGPVPWLPPAPAPPAQTSPPPPPRRRPAAASVAPAPPASGRSPPAATIPTAETTKREITS